jgi:hypothetical protein
MTKLLNPKCEMLMADSGRFEYFRTIPSVAADNLVSDPVKPYTVERGRVRDY